ncbi:MAG: UDP-N-acetylmuramate dehydrogenase, partial [Bacteroidaceae bacterium]|nr:UDP-N-acetylmuramate dehydrogenase [Bacteroidaceae bacterium]
LKESHATIPCYRVDDDNVKIPAAWLIEQCGWKGRSLGKAAVHARQPLVLVNAGGASGKDIMELCRCVQADVRERFGISLHPEVIVL